MRTINTFESVISKVHQMSENYFDETIPVTDMMFHSIDRMWISGKEVEVLPSAQRLFANRLVSLVEDVLSLITAVLAILVPILILLVIVAVLLILVRGRIPQRFTT